jgi:purine-binding chemotaxis protein CheW
MHSVFAEPSSGFPPAESVLRKTRGRRYLTFRLDSQMYGIDFLQVQGIRNHGGSACIADLPPRIQGGVIGLQEAAAVPAVDLRRLFGVMHPAEEATGATVVLSTRMATVGVMVDAISDVIDLKSQDIRPAPQFGEEAEARYITGICSLDRGTERHIVLLIDIEQLISTYSIGTAQASAAH